MINSTGSQMEKVIVFESHFHVNVIDYILKKCASNEEKIKQRGPLEKNSYAIESNDIISRMAPSHLLLKLTIFRRCCP